MKDDRPLSVPAVQRLIARVGIVRVALCFVTINVPIALMLGLLVAWRGPNPGGMELAFRGTVAFAAFLMGGTLFVWRIVRLDRQPKQPK